MYHLSVIGSVGPPERYLDSIEGWFENIQLQTFFGWTEHIIVYAQWHSIFDKFTHLKNVKFIKETGKGVYNAWNQGIQASTTLIVTNWNIDDRRYPRANEIKWIQLKKNPDAGLVYNWTEVTNIENDDPKNPKGIWRQFQWLAQDDPNWKYQCQCGSDPMWRKELHEKVGYFDGKEFPVAADWDMWMRFNQIGTTMILLREPLCIYYLNSNGVSTSKEGVKRNKIDNQKIYRKYGVLNE